MSGEHKTLAAALVAAQAEMPAVKTDKTADTGKFKYDYVTLDHLVAKTRPVLKKNGLAIVQHVRVLDTGQPVLCTTVLHESGERLNAGEMPLFSEKSMQPFGGAVTYARRYSWAAALGICSEDDDDAQSAAPAKASAGTPLPHRSKKEGAAAASAAPPPPAAESELERMEKQLYELALKIGTDPATVKPKVDEKRGKPGFFAWLAKQVERFEASVENRESDLKTAENEKNGGEFQIPEKARAA